MMNPSDEGLVKGSFAKGVEAAVVVAEVFIRKVSHAGQKGGFVVDPRL